MLTKTIKDSFGDEICVDSLVEIQRVGVSFDNGDRDVDMQFTEREQLEIFIQALTTARDEVFKKENDDDNN